MEELRDAMTQSEAVCLALQAKVGELEAERQRLQEMHEQQLQEQQGRAVQAEATEVERLQGGLEASHQAVEEKEAIIARRQERIDALEAERQEQEGRMAELVLATEGARTATVEQQQWVLESEQLQAQLAALQEGLVQAEEGQRQAVEQLGEAQAAAAARVAELEAAQQDAAGQRQALQETKEKAKAKILEMRAQLEGLKGELAAKEAEASSLGHQQEVVVGLQQRVEEQAAGQGCPLVSWPWGWGLWITPSWLPFGCPPNATGSRLFSWR